MFDIEYKQEFSTIENKIKQNEIKQVEKLTNRLINAYLKYVILEIFKYNQKVLYEIKSWRIVYDGINNAYLYVEFNPYGLMIISLINNESIIINPFLNANNLEKYKKSKKLILDFSTLKVKNINTEDIKTFNVKSTNKIDNPILNALKEKNYSINDNLNNALLKNEYKKLLNFKKIKDTNISIFNNKKPPKIYKPKNDEYLQVQKEITYSWWFRKAMLRYDFGETDDKELGYTKPEEDETGLCHYIALAMLLQYAEFFYSKDVFSDKQIEKYITKRTKMLYPEYYPEWTEKYPVIPKISKELVKDLWQIYGKGKIRTTSLYLRQVAEYFIHENKSRYDKKPNVTFHRRSAGWIKPWKWINDNKPCIIYGLTIPNPPSVNEDKKYIGHAIIAYGYTDNGNKLLCHYGWEGYSQILVSSSLSGQLWLLGVSKTGDSKKPREYFYHNGKYISGVDFNK